MRHLFLLICFIALFLFVSCIPGEESICFPENLIYFRTTSKIDSVHFFLNNEQICFQEVIMNNGRCKNCKEIKGIFIEYTICQTSVDSGFLSTLPYNQNAVDVCLVSDDFPIWTTYECTINEKLYGKTLDSSILSLHLFSENVIKSIESKITIQSGAQYNVNGKGLKMLSKIGKILQKPHRILFFP
jgi:hypothetical protein